MLWLSDTAESYVSECGRYRLEWERVGFGHSIWKVYRDGREVALFKTLTQAQAWAEADLREAA